MNLRLKAACCLLIAMISTSAVRAQYIPDEIWPPVVASPFNINQVWQWFRDRNYAALYRMAKEQAVKQARKELNDYIKNQINEAKLSARINYVLEDPIMTLTQKYDALMQMTDNSFEAHTSAPSGDLHITLKHSIEFGVTRIEWDDKVRDGTQSSYRATGSCNDNTGPMSCSWGAVYSRCYYRSQPDYHIYRIVNGQETLITSFRGSMYSSPYSNFQLNQKLWSLAWDAAQYYYTTVVQGAYPPVVPGRAFFYDFQAEFRPKGSTLSYRVVTFDDWLFPVFDSDGDGYGDSVACGAATGGSHTTTVSADANGDGRMDYLTADDYSKYFGKYYGWLPAVLGILE